MTTLTSTTAKVRDPQKAREVIDSYELRSVEIDLREGNDGWTVSMAFHDNGESPTWPRAVRRERMPGRDRFDDDFHYSAAASEVFLDEGDSGVLGLMGNWPLTSVRR